MHIKLFDQIEHEKIKNIPQKIKVHDILWKAIDLLIVDNATGKGILHCKERGRYWFLCRLYR